MSSNSRATEYVADTVAVILRLERRKIGKAAMAAFEQAEAGRATIYVPSFTLAEILYLSEKKRVQTNLKEVNAYLARHPSINEYPLIGAIIDTAAEITDIKELHDRLIAATARFLDLPLITNDAVMQASSFAQTIWD
jgi:predicted nucleic acid-binding protein